MKRALLIVLVVLSTFSFLRTDGRSNIVQESNTVQTPSSDLTTPGPYTVVREEYDFGDTAFKPTGFPFAVELRGSVHYPSNWIGEPLPLLVFIHDLHATCFQGNSVSTQWPCPAPQQPIPLYQGFDYISQVLASKGYMVVSISANGFSADNTTASDIGGSARAQLIQKHLDLWNSFNTVGGTPFGTKFIGKINMQRIGTMGHGFGGQGVVRHFQLNQSLGSPYGIKGVFALASSNFTNPLGRLVLNNVPLAVLLPYCDGGNAFSLEGVQFYDDARYNVPGDTAPKHTILVLGANHNFYNTIMTPAIFQPGARDDWSGQPRNNDSHCGRVPGNGRLTEAQQRATGLTYISAFLRVYVGGESQFLPLLTGAEPPPPSAGSNNIHVSYHAPDNPLLRRDVNRLLNAGNLATNTLGGAVIPSGLAPYDVCGGQPPQAAQCLNLPPDQIDFKQPHTSGVFFQRGLSQLITGWNEASASVVHDLPVGQRDVSKFDALQFRASVNFTDPRNVAGAAQDFRVVLTDEAGQTASVRVSDLSSALFYPPGSPNQQLVPRLVLNTVRLPLTAFSGVDLSKINSIRFVFDQRPQGALVLTDLAFASTVPTSLLPAPLNDFCLKDDSTGASLVFNSTTGSYTFCCGQLTIRGVGIVSKQRNFVTLVQGANETDRSVAVRIDTRTNQASASFRSSARAFCTIIDSNITDNTCSCNN